MCSWCGRTRMTSTGTAATTRCAWGGLGTPHIRVFYFYSMQDTAALFISRMQDTAVLFTYRKQDTAGLIMYSMQDTAALFTCSMQDTAGLSNKSQAAWQVPPRTNMVLCVTAWRGSISQALRDGRRCVLLLKRSLLACVCVCVFEHTGDPAGPCCDGPLPFDPPPSPLPPPSLVCLYAGGGCSAHPGGCAAITPARVSGQLPCYGWC